jgi:hypothetical protein
MALAAGLAGSAAPLGGCAAGVAMAGVGDATPGVLVDEAGSGGAALWAGAALLVAAGDVVPGVATPWAGVVAVLVATGGAVPGVVAGLVGVGLGVAASAVGLPTVAVAWPGTIATMTPLTAVSSWTPDKLNTVAPSSTPVSVTSAKTPLSLGPA